MAYTRKGAGASATGSALLRAPTIGAGRTNQKPTRGGDRDGMIPLGAEATDAVLGWGDGLHRTVALHHAAIHGRPGLWGDDRARPSSVVWLRDGGDQWEAFAAGFAGPALAWLARAASGRPIILAAPPSWAAIVEARLGQAHRVETRLVETWLRPEPPVRLETAIDVRPLDLDDAAAFARLAPAWALRGWGDFGTLLDRGGAFGVPGPSGLAAIAWVVESDHHLDKVGVITDPRFRRLGLGQAVAAALLDAIEHQRARHPLWVVDPANRASVGLARSLGFRTRISEPLLRWEP